MNRVKLTKSEADILREMIDFRLESADSQGDPIQPDRVPYVIIREPKYGECSVTFDENNGDFLAYCLSELDGIAETSAAAAKIVDSLRCKIQL